MEGGRERERERPPGKKNRVQKQNTKTSRLLSSPWCQNGLFWRPLHLAESLPKVAPRLRSQKDPNRFQKATKKQPKEHPETRPKSNPGTKWNPYFPQMYLKTILSQNVSKTSRLPHFYN